MFFHNVLHQILNHWLAITIYIVTLILTVPLLKDFWHQFMSNDFWDDLDHTIDRMPKLSRWTAFILINIILFVVRILGAPILWIIKFPIEAHWRKVSAEEYRQKQEKEQVAESAKRLENAKRADDRKAWFAEHRPKLYYRTIGGLTAVLRPDDYADAHKDTISARLDGFWEKEGILRVSRHTFIFATKQGLELLTKNFGENVLYQMTSGWVSALHEVVEMGNAELICVDDIFVPWVNESLVLFEDQKSILRQAPKFPKTCSLQELVEKQAPESMQHIM